MEDKDLEQTIDQQPSTSQLDQITKIPEPKPKVKNPKRVAAGKKLSEYNKKAKEQQRLIQENNEEENDDEKNSGWLPETSFTTVITVLGLGLSAIDLFLRYKSQSNYSKIEENNNQESDESKYEDVTKIKVINDPQHIGGME